MIFNLPYPPSTNNLFVNVPGRGRVTSKAYASWKKAAALSLMAQRVKPILGPVEVSLIIEEKNLRSDLDNHSKSAIDALVAAGIIETDRAKCLRKLTLEWGDVHGARVEVLERAR